MQKIVKFLGLKRNMGNHESSEDQNGEIVNRRIDYPNGDYYEGKKLEKLIFRPAQERKKIRSRNLHHQEGK